MSDKENLLSPEELDALAEGMHDGAVDLVMGLNTQVSAIKHDLINEESSKGINTSALNPINERILLGFKRRLSSVNKSVGEWSSRCGQDSDLWRLH